MKPNLIFFAVLIISGSLRAQELVSKKGEPILPEAGDWAIQINAEPFFNYAGNIFNRDGTNTISAQPLSSYPFSIAAKYFSTETTAFRGKATLNYTTVSVHNFVIRDEQVAPIDPNETVRDSKKSTDNNIILGGGIEKRKGKTRLQGYYGGELVFMYNGGSRTTYSYGNPFSADNTTPSSTIDFGTGESDRSGSREISSRTGTSFGIGARGFLGAEYFFIPKISVGLEYGWGLMYSSTGDGQIIVQEWDTTESTVKRTISRTAGENSFGISGDISGGAINLTLHF